jgi:hypothetical protein
MGGGEPLAVSRSPRDFDQVFDCLNRRGIRGDDSHCRSLDSTFRTDFKVSFLKR